MYKVLTLAMTGITPYIPSSSQLSYPLAISGKRKKTDSDYIEMAKMEWLASWYLNYDGQPIIPGGDIGAMIYHSAEKEGKGKAIKSSLRVEDALLNGGWKDFDLETLFNNFEYRFRYAHKTKAGIAWITRPIIKSWNIKTIIHYLESEISKSEIDVMLQRASVDIGLGYLCPHYGRFSYALK